MEDNLGGQGQVEIVSKTIHFDLESDNGNIDPHLLGRDRDDETNMINAVRAMVQETFRYKGFGASQDEDIEWEEVSCNISWG